jgi:4-hydroxybenzoyl-CoA reductase subunit beta
MSETRSYLKPQTAEEAVMMAQAEESFRFLAGGTDVLVNKFQGNDESSCLIDITGIGELHEINVSEKLLRIGSSVTLEEIIGHTAIAAACPLIVEAARSVASPVIRMTATLGGNLLCDNRCVFYNQSEWWRNAIGYCLKCDGDVCIASGGKKNCYSRFVSDLAVALISLHAEVEVIEYGSSYVVPLADIYSGNGVTPHKFSRTSLIKSIRVHLSPGTRSAFQKLRKRRSLDFTSLTLAVTSSRAGAVRIVIGGVDPKPIVIDGTHKDAEEELIRLAMKKPRIVDNDVYSREYRKVMIGVLLGRCFGELR